MRTPPAALRQRIAVQQRVHDDQTTQQSDAQVQLHQQFPSADAAQLRSGFTQSGAATTAALLARVKDQIKRFTQQWHR